MIGRKSLSQFYDGILLSHLLITGIIAVVSGFVCVWPWRKRSAARFYKAAEKVLSGVQSFEPSEHDPVLVHFVLDGMILSERISVSYDNFKHIIETDRIYLMIWKERVTVLQKRDLIDEMPEDFLSFLEEKTGLKAYRLHSHDA